MIRIERMRPEHVLSVAEIERASFAMPWTDLMFYADLAGFDISRYYVALSEEKIVGYIGMQMAPPNAHITTFAVHPAYRGKGIGTRLLAHLMIEAIAEDITNITLEVRVSNSKARQLYASFGFVEQETHENYYIDNQEDAIILWARDIDSRAFRENIARLLRKPMND